MSETCRILSGLRVIDAGIGMPAAVLSKVLRELGATVIRREPAGGDPGRTRYPAYSVWRAGQQLSQAPVEELLVGADVCIVGGEDFPGVSSPIDARAAASANPRLVVVEITGYPPVAAHRVRPAVEVLVQARSGLAYEHFTDRPIRFGFEACTYGAVMQAITGALAALNERERSGRGQLVMTSLYEGALFYALSFWSDVEKPNQRTEFTAPKDPYPLIFQCADGDYIHLGLGSAGSKYQLYKVLGIDDPSVAPNDPGIPTPTDDKKNFFADIDLLARHVKPWKRDALQEALDRAKVPTEKVLAPGECWEDPQVIANGVIVRDADGTRHVGIPFEFEESPAPKGARAQSGPGPLDGIRIVDFGAFVAGPFASAMLADLGARVIKVEALSSDPSRGMFHAFNGSNRGKYGLAMDIKAPQAAPIIAELVRSADVVTNNFRPGVSARLGLDGPSLHRERPEIVVLESPAYGSEGPKATKAGFDPIIQALTGHEHRGGGAGNAPLWNRGFMADFTGGQWGAIAMLAALLHRERTGAGATVTVALVNAGIFALSELIQRPDGTFVGAPPLDRDRTGFHPAEAMYQAADGWIALALRSDAAVAALARVLSLGTQLDAPLESWGEREARLIGTAVRGRTAANLLRELESAGVWCEECRRDGRREALQDPDLLGAGTICETVHRDVGRVRAVGPLVRFSRSRRGVVKAPPLIGQDTREVLGDLGLESAEIDKLLQDKVVA